VLLGAVWCSVNLTYNNLNPKHLLLTVLIVQQLLKNLKSHYDNAYFSPLAMKPDPPAIEIDILDIETGHL